MKKIIGMLGQASSGKDTAARFVRETLPGTTTLSFADPLKEFAQEVFEFSSATLYGSSSKRGQVFSEFGETVRWAVAKERLLRFAPGWCSKVLMTYDDSPVARKLYDAVLTWYNTLRDEAFTAGGLSCRRVLQTLGTECGRTVNVDIWTAYAIYRAEEYLREPECAAAVLTDVRYLNEAKMIREKAGELWFLDRPVVPLEGQAGQHSSELDIRAPEMQQYVTRTFKNVGSLEELQRLVNSAVDETFNRHPYWTST